jgi:hypothetical protein
VTELLKKATQPASVSGWAVTAGALLLVWMGEHLPLPSLVRDFGDRGLNIAAVATFDRRDDRDAARITVTSI